MPPQIRRSDCQRYEQPPLPAATLRNCVFSTLITSQLPPPSYYHSPRTITTCLPSKKGRWIAGKAQTVALLRFTCDTPAFFNLPNLSAVKTEGLHSVSTIILMGELGAAHSRPPFYKLLLRVTPPFRHLCCTATVLKAEFEAAHSRSRTVRCGKRYL